MAQDIFLVVFFLGPPVIALAAVFGLIRAVQHLRRQRRMRVVAAAVALMIGLPSGVLAYSLWTPPDWGGPHIQAHDHK